MNLEVASPAVKIISKMQQQLRCEGVRNIFSLLSSICLHVVEFPK